ncbi:hypothetical protein D3C86_1479410 [compost metagenome]
MRAGPVRAALGRVHAGDHLGAVVGQGLFGVEAAGLAGQALHDDLGVLVDENGHGALFVGRVQETDAGIRNAVNGDIQNVGGGTVGRTQQLLAAF